ncbi:hypothetical protein [Motilimonas pumila]|uniref:Uncharacterized protein n=1 Tax=Motilimonas pumila TaxID=2303987 RepID=A0A418YHF6_9GAMM|nr:hypothetical protein [Motilimonas pumila]RJG49531.1 hypothetical protein D1Z90_06120 [Motilimonas pumila]
MKFFPTEQYSKPWWRALQIIATVWVLVGGFLALQSSAIMFGWLTPPALEQGTPLSEVMYVARLFVVLGVLYVAAGIGLLLRTSWGKVLGYIACATCLMAVPLGTAMAFIMFFAIRKNQGQFGARPGV